jgi:hypothetical protein
MKTIVSKYGRQSYFSSYNMAVCTSCWGKNGIESCCTYQNGELGRDLTSRILYCLCIKKIALALCSLVSISPNNPTKTRTPSLKLIH